MIYESVVTTGNVTVSGCMSSDMGGDLSSKRNVFAVNTIEKFYFDTDLTTGQDTIRLSLNAQTLQQEIPVESQAINEKIFQIFTGDFFTKSETAPLQETSVLNFDGSTPAKATSNIVYNIITGGIFAGTGDLGPSLRTGINGRYSSAKGFDDFHYFLNGIKVYSGSGVGLLAGENLEPNFGTASSVGGIVTTASENKFKYLAFKKSPNTDSLISQHADIKGPKFVEKRTNYYINGVEELQSNFLELYTGVSIIKSGFSAVLPESGFGGATSKEEFNL